jgi:hypothetical protein
VDRAERLHAAGRQALLTLLLPIARMGQALFHVVFRLKYPPAVYIAQQGLVAAAAFGPEIESVFPHARAINLVAKEFTESVAHHSPRQLSLILAVRHPRDGILTRLIALLQRVFAGFRYLSSFQQRFSD